MRSVPIAAVLLALAPAGALAALMIELGPSEVHVGAVRPALRWSTGSGEVVAAFESEADVDLRLEVVADGGASALFLVVGEARAPVAAGAVRVPAGAAGWIERASDRAPDPAGLAAVETFRPGFQVVYALEP